MDNKVYKNYAQLAGYVGLVQKWRESNGKSFTVIAKVCTQQTFEPGEGPEKLWFYVRFHGLVSADSAPIEGIEVGDFLDVSGFLRFCLKWGTYQKQVHYLDVHKYSILKKRR